MTIFDNKTLDLLLGGGEFSPAMIEKLENIPHGSGINCDWVASVTKTAVLLQNSYQVMNDAGFYVGFADFTISLPRAAFLAEDWKTCRADFRLMFNGRESQYLNRQYMLRDYLEDTFSYWLSE